HTGSGYSDVKHIGAAPACAKNERFPVDQRRAFEAGECSPDFAVENYGVDFESRFTADMLSPLMTGPDGI
ncbi:MAG: YbiU family protein, partial [Rhodobiaceae bacterium]